MSRYSVSGFIHIVNGIIIVMKIDSLNVIRSG
nr:MAG TPA: hypothetical protein [Crassvirales sp.]